MLAATSRLSRPSLLAVAVALVAFGAARGAVAQTITFTFESPPDNWAMGDQLDPVYTEAGFTVLHLPGTYGHANWIFDGGPIELADPDDSPYGPLSTVITFSEDVESFSIAIRNNQDGGDSPHVIAHIVGGGEDDRILDYSPSEFTVYTFDDGGPYESVEVSGDYENTLSWDEITVTLSGPAYPPNATSLRDISTGEGENQTLIELDAFVAQASSITSAGVVNADFCVGRDPRQIVIRGRDVYTPRWLSLSELANTGSCLDSVPLPPDPALGGAISWSGLLTQTGLKIAPWYRSFKGKFTPPGGLETEAYWIVVGIVRSTAEFDGEIAVKTIPEELITYPAGATIDGELKCNTILDRRPLSLGGTVPAFGDYPNVEGNKMIMETAQCNRPASLTRRTTHAYPMALDGFIFDELLNLAGVLDGLDRTLLQAWSVCPVSDRPILNTMRGYLTAARVSILLRRWSDAVARLENIARIAKYPTTGLSGCPAGSNYTGGIVARSLAASFTVYDRLWHRASGGSWSIYEIPGDLDVPLLTSDD